MSPLLHKTRCYLSARDRTSPAHDLLRQEAEEALTAGPFTVTSKTKLPPSGDPHDYYSVGPYWWPDPAKPDGLPYIRRDGEVNPERHATDHKTLDDFCQTTRTLSLAWALLDQKACAERAVELLRIFFIDEATRVNPHLDYGQAIPGQCDGRGIGIIDTLRVTAVVDAILMLRESGALSATIDTALQAWFGAYTQWLLESDHGKDESTKKNNHGTAYDLQVATFATYAGHPQIARDILATVAGNRLAKHLQPDGSQPHELARTRALDYSAMNLQIMLDLAAIAQRYDIDLWQWQGDNGGSIQKAVDWMLPSWTGKIELTYQQIVPFNPARGHQLLLQAAHIYGPSPYLQAADSLAVPPASRSHLLAP